MPNGYPYFLYASENYCERCDEPLCNHDRRRVAHGGGQFGFEYHCQDGGRCRVPDPRATANA